MIWICNSQKTIKRMRLVIGLVFTLCCVAVLCAACSKQGASLTAMSSSSFDSAPAQVREKWQKASESVSRKDFLGSATNLMILFSQADTLTAEQRQALQLAWVQVGNQAFKAAENGDKMALQAVQRMNASPYGKSPGDR
jgi:hypothetical protein